MGKRSYEQVSREYDEARASYQQAIRRWLEEKSVTITSGDDLTAWEVNYNVAHQDEVAAMEALAVEVSVARAALQERMVVASELAAQAHDDAAAWARLSNKELRKGFVAASEASKGEED